MSNILIWIFKLKTKIMSEQKIELDLSAIDWNKLSIADFILLEKDLQNKHTLIKASQPKERKLIGFDLIKVKGKVYRVKKTTIDRLKKMKSDKSREKLIEEIISTHNPIETL